MTKEIHNLCPGFQQKKLKTMNESTMTNVITTQRRKYYVGVSMNESTMVNVTTTQCHRYYVGISMNESTMTNVTTTQCHRYYVGISMNESIIANVATTQRRRCCSFDSPGLASVASYPGKAFARRFNAIGVELFLRKHDYSERIHGRLIKKAQHLRRCVPCYVLTQGSSLCSPTLGYQKRNPDGVRQFANILCADLPFEMAIKSRRRWGSSICKHPLRPLFLLTRDEIKKAQHLWRCVPRNILTQGSSLRSPTLGYQKQNPDGVRRPHKLSLRRSSF